MLSLPQQKSVFVNGFDKHSAFRGHGRLGSHVRGFVVPSSCGEKEFDDKVQESEIEREKRYDKSEREK